MPRFLVEHRHRDETCPSSNPEMARQLADHLSPSNAAQYDVRVLSDCVLPGEHTMYIVVEAEGPEKVASFVHPFMNVGPTTVRPAITCEVVASRGSD